MCLSFGWVVTNHTKRPLENVGIDPTYCGYVIVTEYTVYVFQIGLKTAAFDGAIFEPTAAMGARAAHDLKVCLEVRRITFIG